MFGADANCGRILCAAGYAETDCDVTKADVFYASEAGKIKVAITVLVLHSMRKRLLKSFQRTRSKFLSTLNRAMFPPLPGAAT